MRFRYHKFNLGKPSNVLGKFILRPIIPIRLKFKDQDIRYAALIDSGADFCIFDAEIGEYLGVNILSGKKES